MSIVFTGILLSLFSLELIIIEFLLVFEDFQGNVILFDFASEKIMRLSFPFFRGVMVTMLKLFSLNFFNSLV